MVLTIDPAMPTADVARSLLGARVCRRLDDGTLLAGRIVETEAYLGLEDPACHSFHGRRTPRVASLYRPAGHAYVYRIYGLHLCLNVVTRAAEQPEAVLLRALAPLEGAARMRALRGGGDRIADDLCRGPAKLTRALDVGMALDGHALDAPPLWLEAGPPVPVEAVAVGVRVGLSERVGSRAWPLRFWIEGDSHVSLVGRRGRRGGVDARHGG